MGRPHPHEQSHAHRAGDHAHPRPLSQTEDRDATKYGRQGKGRVPVGLPAGFIRQPPVSIEANRRSSVLLRRPLSSLRPRCILRQRNTSSWQGATRTLIELTEDPTSGPELGATRKLIVGIRDRRARLNQQPLLGVESTAEQPQVRLKCRFQRGSWTAFHLIHAPVCFRK